MPGASISLLPTEIKAKIAEMCREQDDNYKETVRRLRAHGYPFEVPFPIAKTAPEMSSLWALSLVSREWADLTAPLRFRSLGARHIDSGMFRLHVGVKHASCVTKVDLTRIDSVSFSSVLASLTSMSGVRHVELPSLSTLWDSIVKDLPASTSHARSADRLGPLDQLALSALGSRLKQVASISTGLPHSWTGLCESSNALHTLAVICMNEEAMGELCGVTRERFPNLATLNISIGDQLQVDEVDHLTAWNDPPALKHLIVELSADVFHPVLRWLRAAASVETLRIDLGISISAVNPTFTRDFINLHSLEVCATSHNTEALIGSVIPDRFPRLRRLRLEDDFFDSYSLWMIYEDLKVFAESYHEYGQPVEITCDLASSAYAFRLDPAYLPTPVFGDEKDTDAYSDDEINSRSRAFTARWPRRKIHRAPAFPAAGLFNVTSIRRAGTVPENLRSDTIDDEIDGSIDDIVNSISNMAGQARQIGDVVQLARIMQALQQCEHLRLEHES